MNPVHTPTHYADFSRGRIIRAKAPPEVEQELVRSFFENCPEGFFVDVGANDPFKDSQSFHLESLGWKGLLIEPLPSYCDLLRQHRSGRVIQMACSSPENHGKTLPIHVAGVHSTLEAQPIAIGAVAQGVIHINVQTLDSILEENQVVPGFDLLSIDVEGHEMELFKGFNLARWQPRLVLLEDHVTNHQKHRHMVGSGYRLLLRTGLNSWYVPASGMYTHSLGARFEYLRKYWLGLATRRLKYRKASV